MTFAQLQIVAPVFIVGSAFAFIGLERLFPYKLHEKVFRDEFWSDLIGYGVFQSYVMAAVIGWLCHYIDTTSGLSRLHLVSDWPIWVQVVFFIITHDLVTYLIHRSQHNSKFLWRTHEAHHAPAHVDWLSGIRSHSLEILLYQTAEYLPVILLGAAPEVPLYKSMANATYGMYIHANLNWRMGKFIYFLNGPELHRWHHSEDDPAAYDKNYATKFTIWDLLFGSIFWPKKPAVKYGAGDPNFPRGWIKQHLYTFRPFAAKPTESAKENDLPPGQMQPEN